MMLTLDDIRGYIGGLGITADRNVYIGKLNSKKDHSIGVYHRQGSGPPVMALHRNQTEMMIMKKFVMSAVVRRARPVQ